MVFLVGAVCLVVGGVLGYAFRGKENTALKQLGGAVANEAKKL